MTGYIYNLGQLFSKIAEANSVRTAIIFEKDGSTISFGELDKLSNQIVNILNQHQVLPGNVVGIYNNKTKYGFASMLAALKLGAAYVNLDFNNPAERLEKIILRAVPKIIITDKGINADVLYFGIESLDYNKNSIAEETEKQDTGTPAGMDNVTSSAPAYIMFTSGSTGFPKGAVMTHQNLLNFIGWGKQRFSITEADLFTNVNPVYFDNSVFDFYCSLFNSASLLAFSYETMKIPSEVVKTVNCYKATSWFSVPSMLIYLLTTKSLSEGDFPLVRNIIFGGEGFPKPNMKKLYNLFGNRITLVNVYGPTECTCICSAYNISESDFDDMLSLAPLGRLAPNFGYSIEKTEGSDAGELLLTGPQVGRGYYNDPERTTSSFIKNPEIKNYTDFVYKTGDLVSEDENGILYFRGRKDNQIKHMGYRIELEEIESAVNTIAGVNESAVIYKKSEVYGGQIYCFITTGNGLNQDKVLTELRNKVPSYMVPRSVSVLDKMPKNKNGKTDKIHLLELIQ